MPAAIVEAGVPERPPDTMPVGPGLIGPTIVVIAATAVVASLPRAPYPLPIWLFLQVTGLVFAVCGVVLWWQRPANGTGRLMAVVALTWYVGNLQLIGSPVAFALGFSLYHAQVAALTHLVLALPDGRLHRRSERRFVVGCYVAAVATQVVRCVVEWRPEPQGWGDPGGRYSVWASVSSVLLVAGTAVTVGMVVRRWSRAGRYLRRTYSWVWTTIVVLGGVIVGAGLAALLHAPVPVQRALAVLTAACLLLSPVALAIGLLRVRLQRARVAELVLRLRQATDPADLQTAIARALGDPGLRLWFPMGDGLATVDGMPVAPDVDGRGRSRTPVEHRGRVLAVLVHDPALEEDRALLGSVLATAALALDNARLVTAERARSAELGAAAARIVTAADAERRRIQRELHDGVQHRLLATAVLLGRVSSGPDPPAEVRNAMAHLRDALVELRTLTNTIAPAALGEQGLAAAVEVLAERAPVPVVTDIPPGRWPEPVERAAYYVVAEALTNVYKYAHASRVGVRIAERPGVLTVTVEDDGIGGARISAGTGLQGLRDRALALGGRFDVRDRPGGGVRVQADLPCVS
ncbi:sensor histidine kinase [Blastococcus sp. SYSU D00669]